MTEEIIQQDFGGFNPRFMGICVKVGSPQMLHMWQNFLTSDTEAPHNASLAEISMKSVLEHEVRHYHDFLVSPYSTFLLRMRLQGLFNGVQVFNTIADCDGDCVPMPLSQWIVMNEAERQVQIEDWSIASPPPNERWRPISVQTKTKDELLTPLPAQVIDVNTIPRAQLFDHALEWTVRSYLRIQQIVGGFGGSKEYPELRPCNIYETTALTAQWQAIYQSQGAREANLFVQYLLNSQLGYAVMWQRFFQLSMLLDSKRPVADKADGQLPEEIMKMAVWCLLGNYELEGSDACPTIRFYKLLQHIFKDFANPQNWRGNVAEVWSYWDSRIEVPSWRDSLKKLLQFNKRGVDTYVKMGSLLPELANNALTTTMNTFLEEQRIMVELLLERPERLVDPNEYLTTAAAMFPVPHCKVDLDGFAVSLSSIQGFESLWTIKGDDDNLYSTRFAFRPGGGANDPAVLRAAVDLEGLMNWCDLAFSTHEMPPEVFGITLRDVTEHIQKPVFLIV